MWGLRAQIKELEAEVVHLKAYAASQTTVANLMLQEREYFAKQVRDIRAAWAGGTLDIHKLSGIFARPNPMP